MSPRHLDYALYRSSNRCNLVIVGPNEALPESCDYFLVSCDQQLRFCLLDCRGPRVPYLLLTMFDQDKRELQVLTMMKSNSGLRRAVSGLTLPTVRKFSIPRDRGLESMP